MGFSTVVYKNIAQQRLIFMYQMSSVISRSEKGLRRWVDLPSSADYATEIGLIPPDNSDPVTVALKQQRRYEPMTELSSLRYAVEEWRSAWKISMSQQSY